MDSKLLSVPGLPGGPTNDLKKAVFALERLETLLPATAFLLN